MYTCVQANRFQRSVYIECASNRIEPDAHQPTSRLEVVMCIQLKCECVSPAFVIGSGTLTRTLVSSAVQPAAISNAKTGKKVHQQLCPHKKTSTHRAMCSVVPTVIHFITLCVVPRPLSSTSMCTETTSGSGLP